MATLSQDDRFKLITKLISTPERIEGVARDYVALEKMVRTDFLRLTGDFCFPGESRLYHDLLGLLDEFRELVEFPHLANKNVVAIGGGFSSGKSRFVNALLGVKHLLPTGINPTTAIPTFLTWAAEEKIRALNTFNRSEALSREDFRDISHAFNDGEEAQDSPISFYHILKLVQIGTPDFRWNNIAFLDTPGYSKPHLEGDETSIGTDAGNTDEEKACEHLKQADFLIWAVPATQGTLPQNDIEFLVNKVKWKKEIYLLITKSDEQTEDDLQPSVTEICETFKSRFSLAGWSAYSAKRGAALLGDNPSDWLDSINKKQKRTRWGGRFKVLIDEVIEYNAREGVAYASDLEKGFRTLYTNSDGVLTAENEAKVKKLVDELARERKSYATAKEQFILFERRLEEKIKSILKKLGLADETVPFSGLLASCPVEDAMRSWIRGKVLEGVVENYSRFTGCYIRVAGIKKEIHIRRDDLCGHYTAPEQQFAKGNAVRLVFKQIKNKVELHDVDEAVFIVTPAMN